MKPEIALFLLLLASIGILLAVIYWQFYEQLQLTSKYNRQLLRCAYWLPDNLGNAPSGTISNVTDTR